MLNPLDDTPAGGEATGKCTFQFWVDRIESFYCKLDQCKWSFSDSAGELLRCPQPPLAELTRKISTAPSTRARNSTASASRISSSAGRTGALVSYLRFYSKRSS